MLTQQSKSSYSDTLVQYTNSIDSLVADKSTGLNTAISKFFNTMGAYAADPTNKALAGAITGSAKEVAQRMTGMSTLVTQIQSDARSALTDSVAQINTPFGLIKFGILLKAQIQPEFKSPETVVSKCVNEHESTIMSYRSEFIS